MSLKIDQVIYSSIWILLLAFSISALRIPAIPSADKYEYRHKPARLAKQFSTYSSLADLPSTGLEPIDFKQYGAKRVIMRYGPYTVPPSMINNGMKEFTEAAANRPCADCYITKLQAGLEYPNGSIANSNTGMWLHHAVLYDFGRKDLACPDLPYRFFASGNERTRLDMTLNGTLQTGFPLLSDTVMGITVEFMNELPIPRDTILTLEFEYIPTLRKDFRPLDALWLDITGVCGESEADIPPDKEVFEYHTPNVQVNTSGTIVAAGGHLHDGGTLCRITLNGRVLCDFIPTYGGSAGYIDNIPMSLQITNHSYPQHQFSNESSTRYHISNMPLCYRVGKFHQGDSFGIIAYYNLTQHEPMIGGKGGFEAVMGIAILYLENDIRQNPSSPALSVTTAPITGITVTQSNTVNLTSTPAASPTKPTISVPTSITVSGTSDITITPIPSKPPSSIISLSTVPIVTTITIETLGFRTTLTLSTSIIVTVVPASTTSSGRPVTAITSPLPSTSVTIPSSTASTPISSSSRTTPSITTPIHTTPSKSTPHTISVTKPSTGRSSTSQPWWISTSRSRSGLVPVFTQRSGTWTITYISGTRTSIRTTTTAKPRNTAPAMLIPIPLILPFGPTIVNPYWTITIPLPNFGGAFYPAGLGGFPRPPAAAANPRPPATATTRLLEVYTTVYLIPIPTETGCPRGYPCGARITYLS